MTEPPNESCGLRDQVREWTLIRHFTIALSDTSELLRRVADAIDELGDVVVFDITFKSNDESGTKRMTVYFTLDDDECK